MIHASSQEKPLTPVALRLWQRIPLLVRAVSSGFLVSAVGVYTWQIVFATIPAPWSLAVMSGALLFYWRYLGRRPSTGTATRIEKISLRRARKSVGVWTWSLIGAVLAVAAIESGLVVTFRLIQFPTEAWDIGFDYSAIPLWLVWSLVLMSALVAGVCEEIGFRGIAQTPLEERYGPGIAIGVVSIAFVLSHLHQAWAPTVLLHLFAVSVLWGVLAHISGSLIPGIVSHTITDVFSFSYWWTDVAGAFNRQPIAVTGIDSHFVLWALVLVISVGAFCLAARGALSARRRASARIRSYACRQ